MSQAARTIPTTEPSAPHLFLTGVSYRTLDIEWREKLAQVAPSPECLADRVVREGLAKEAAVISTCNRFEIVAVGGDGGGVRAFFESLLALPRESSESIYQYSDLHAVRHLYRVSSSLDSMVLGEGQILGQVKRAYQQAVEAGSVGSYLHHLFQSAFRVAKKVHTHTDIAQNGVSLSYVAVRLAQQIFSELADTTVLIIGSGEMAELAALHLCSHGCQKIVVANRTVERAAQLAERFGGLAVSLSDVDRAIDQADIVIGSISIDRPILTKASVRARKASKPLFLIDLGVPRNFSPALAEQDNLYLYNIDDLAAIAAENKALREDAAKEADIVIEHGLMHFERWRTRLEAKPTIVDVRGRIQDICDAELRGAIGASGALGQEHIQQIAHSISQKIGHELTSMLERHIGARAVDDEEPPFLIVPGTPVRSRGA
jgi:glutamyl-tRNA reductase